MPQCGARVGRWIWGRRCSRPATQAFDMWNPWSRCVFKPNERADQRHYEVCDEHAEMYWPRLGYIEKERAERIREMLLPS